MNPETCKFPPHSPAATSATSSARPSTSRHGKLNVACLPWHPGLHPYLGPAGLPLGSQLLDPSMEGPARSGTAVQAGGPRHGVGPVLANDGSLVTTYWNPNAVGHLKKKPMKALKGGQLAKRLDLRRQEQEAN